MNKIFTSLLVKTIGFYINFLSFVFPEKATLLAYKFFSEPRSGKLSPEAIPDILKKRRLKSSK
ncbi:hypothetical protein [Flavobacterium piscinae]|uniref:hypothetical protein n=1 Tax=Flavobacterium piscinae TaxID=2506424 RepID=UPI002AAB6DF6|nr:hypothetical protein [Flavobacterium piscinae]